MAPSGLNRAPFVVHAGNLRALSAPEIGFHAVSIGLECMNIEDGLRSAHRFDDTIQQTLGRVEALCA